MLDFARSTHAGIVAGLLTAVAAGKNLSAFLVTVDIIAVERMTSQITLMAAGTFVAALDLATSVDGVEVIRFCRSVRVRH